jgi:hypothetical protein
MTDAAKRTRASDVDVAPVPPYPAEVAATWQAFRVKMQDEEVAAGEEPDGRRPDAPPQKR